jgi:hypothetical protein
MVIVLLYSINILFGFAGFGLYNYCENKNSAPGTGTLLTALLIPILFLPLTAALSYYFSYDNWVRQTIHSIPFFLVVYFILHNIKLVKEKKHADLYTKNLLIAKDHAEIEALKLQLDPHFFFNSLNTLQHLITPNNKDARSYVQLLADVYRYILKNKSKELVLLQEELTFSQQYFSLLNIRYGSAIGFHSQIDPIAANDFLIIPISIQILIENGIKHNRFTPEEPLYLVLDMDNDYIVVKNKVRGKSKNDSLRIGLQNLSERSLILTNKPLIVEVSDSEFTVRLPLLKYK